MGCWTGVKESHFRRCALRARENSLPGVTVPATAPCEVRGEVAKVLLDHMWRELAIKVDYLDRLMLERIRLQSNQRLIPPTPANYAQRSGRAGRNWLLRTGIPRAGWRK